MEAVIRFDQYDLALTMLEAGADFRMYMDDEHKRLIHLVAMQEDRLDEYSPEKRAKFRELVKWLEDRGESYEEAKADLARWASWDPPSGGVRPKDGRRDRGAQGPREGRGRKEGRVTPCGSPRPCSSPA
jgi:hypothetical protein